MIYKKEAAMNYLFLLLIFTFFANTSLLIGMEGPTQQSSTNKQFPLLRQLDQALTLEDLSEEDKLNPEYALAITSIKDGIRTAIHNGAKPNTFFRKTNKYITPLLFSLKQRDKELSQFLINHGALVDYAPDLKISDFSYIISPRGYVQANFDSADTEKFLFLFPEKNEARIQLLFDFLATENDGFNLATKLAENNSLLNNQTAEGVTPLIYALGLPFGRAIDVIDLLIKNGADIDLKNNEGFTPLMYAALQEKPDYKLLRFLLDQGASTWITDNNGETVASLVAMRGDLPAEEKRTLETFFEKAETTRPLVKQAEFYFYNPDQRPPEDQEFEQPAPKKQKTEKFDLDVELAKLEREKKSKLNPEAEGLDWEAELAKFQE